MPPQTYGNFNNQVVIDVPESPATVAKVTGLRGLVLNVLGSILRGAVHSLKNSKGHLTKIYVPGDTVVDPGQLPLADVMQQSGFKVDGDGYKRDL